MSKKIDLYGGARSIQADFPKLLDRITYNDYEFAELDLSGLELTEENVIDLAKALESNTTITSLNLSNNFTNSFLNVVTGTKALIQTLKVNKIITNLNLSNNYMGIYLVGSAFHTDLFPITKTLQILDVSNNLLARHIGPLTELLRSNKSIKSINLSNTGIGTEASYYIAKCLETDRTLIEIDLNAN